MKKEKNKNNLRLGPFDSCLWRIPGSINSKYPSEQSKVKIIQRWNGVRAKLDRDFMHTDFLLYLAQQRIDQIREEREKNNKIACYRSLTRSGPRGFPETYRYIEERLLKTPIEDYRKKVVDVIIIPYLVVIKGLTDPYQIESITMHWLDKCAELKRLEPSRQAFAARIRSRTHQVMEAHSKGEAIPPKKLEKLKKENPELYRQLYVPK